MLRFVLDPIAESLGAHALWQQWEAAGKSYDVGKAELTQDRQIPDAFLRALELVERAYGKRAVHVG